jgi:hypothetical protein
MKKISISIFILTIAAGLSHGLGFVVAPPRCELSMGPGQTRTEMITVVNQDNTAPLRLKAYVKAWDKDRKGQINYFDPAGISRSCGNWLVVNPSEFEIPAGGNIQARFTATVPESANGSYWAMIFFESQPDTTTGATVGVRMVGRVGVTVYVNISGTLNFQSQLTAFNYRRAGYQNHEFTVSVKDDGNTYFRPKGTIEVKDASGKKVATAAVPDDYIALPGGECEVKLTVKQVIPPGHYTATVSLDTGLPELLEGEIGFEVVQ